MKALIIGSGGREHALAWRLARSDSISHVYCAPGNAGAALDASCIPVDISSAEELASLAETLGVDFTVIGPEAPLVAGAADVFTARGLRVVGPGAAAARLEGSKVFTKRFLEDNSIPTAEAVVVERPEEIDAAVGRFGFPVALKADGLAAGKGVVIVRDEAEARREARRMLAGETVGEAGKTLLVEQFLVGREVSFILLSDGECVFEFPPTQDHKPLLDNDEGPNTGGMGAYSDDSILSPELRGEIHERIIAPTLGGLAKLSGGFQGFLYAGLMITEDGPKVLEYNVRMGDPETQPLVLSLEGDFGELLASAARGELDSSAVAKRGGAACCVVIASGGYPGAYAKGLEISGVPDAEAAGAKVFHAGTHFKAGKLVTAAGRVLGVTAAGGNLEQALGRSYAAVEKIRFEGMQYRRDIGRRPAGKR